MIKERIEREKQDFKRNKKSGCRQRYNTNNACRKNRK